MRKRIFLFISALCIAGLAGCELKQVGEPEEPDSPKQELVSGDALHGEQPDVSNGEFVSEDCKQGNSTVLKVENRYLYYSPEKQGICYTDCVTGEDGYLCIKTECKHDGKEICVATNERYEIKELRLYNGKLFANVVEETAAKYLFKLLVIEPDGSEARELVTYMEAEKTGGLPDGLEGFQIHRNKAMLPMGVKKTAEDGVYGLAVVDLNTKEVAYLDKEPLSAENPKTEYIRAYKDCFFYCRQSGKRTVLYRYHLTNGEVDTHDMLPSFGGAYGLLDEERVIYLMCKEDGKRKGNEFCIHYLSSGRNEVAKKLTRIYTLGWNSMEDGEPREIVYSAEWMMLDDTYIYVAESVTTGTVEDLTTRNTEEVILMNVHVYDCDLEMVTTVDFGTVLEDIIPEIGQYKEAVAKNHCNLSFFADEVYCTITLPEEDVVCKCSREEFLTGKPKFELVRREQK
ncbi:MAG: hypothetical protein IJZ55_08575 [Lachnospiraceae bacterium]|nr:hypothetical protein [Lachnospiraceae bacterium]